MLGEVKTDPYLPSDKVLDLLEIADLLRCIWEREGDSVALLYAQRFEAKATRLVREEEKEWSGKSF